MQCFDNGSLYTVTVTTREVEAFAETWPCSGLRASPVTFQFEKRNGDLVDSNDAQNHPHADGSAIVALANDAMIYGARRLRLTNVFTIRAREAEDFLQSRLSSSSR